MTQRVAFVTGAMGGLGTSICQELAKAGHKVIAAYHPEFDKPDEWTKEMAAAGFKDFICVSGDIASLESCAAMVAEGEAKAGAPVDILVNNAGITRDRMFAKMELSQWDAVIATNLTSLFNMTKQVSAKMAERGWGRIINISRKSSFPSSSTTRSPASRSPFMATASRSATGSTSRTTAAPSAACSKRAG